MTDLNNEFAATFQGLWGYEQVDRLRLSAPRLTLMVIGVPALVHATVLLLLGDIDPSSTLAQMLAPLSYDVVFIAIGSLTGLYALVPLVAARYLENNIAQSLADIDPIVIETRHLLHPTLATSIILPASVTVVFVGLYEIFLLAPAGLSHLDPRGLVDVSPSLPLLLYLLIPFNTYLAGLLFGFTVQAGSYILETTRNIRIDILQVESYACFALPAVIVFMTACPLLGIIGAAMLLSEGEEMTTFASVLFISVLAIAIATIALLCVNIVHIRNRFAAQIRDEKLAVIAALDGDRSKLASTRVAASAPTETDLVTYLILLDSLSEWPIGPHLQKVVAFGLIPPIAWTLAAIVENTIY